MNPHTHERSPLLSNGEAEDQDDRELLYLSKEDPENPRAWTRNRKLANVAVIASMSILSPLASSMFTPGIQEIADDLGTDTSTVIGATTGFVIFLGLGPLVLAPMSETFGRRRLYIICFSMFTLFQIPTALAPNIAMLIAFRTVAGFFGSIGIANGGGTISDMFEPSERAGVFGWYLLGPLLGPTIGPLLGGITVQRLGWRWIFGIVTIICAVLTLAGFFLLRETYAPIILKWRKQKLEKEEHGGVKYRYEGEDFRPLHTKIATSLYRPIRILVQPIVFIMSVYQALLFSTTYSLYTNMQEIYSGDPYNFNTEQVGLAYLGPGLGFLFAVWFLVPRIDQVYNRLTGKHGGTPKPEYRLPLANIGALFVPIGLFWFAWTVEYEVAWPATIIATFPYGVGQVMILNTVQNYYIDSFEKYAASAIAAGALFRSLVGGVIPLFAPALFEKLGYGWGISVFGFLSLALAPAPILFYIFGERVRKRFPVDL